MIKRLLALLLTAFIVLSFGACQKNAPDKTNSVDTGEPSTRTAKKKTPFSFPREDIFYFNELYGDYEYDTNHNLLTETFYRYGHYVHFVKSHTYDGKNREIAGTWTWQGEEAYRYTNAYDEQDRLTETVWYQGDQEVERFIYTYHEGGYAETFCQNGEKKYTYTFDESGNLTAHSVYKNGAEIKTKDVKSLVKAELLTDLWIPSPVGETPHYDHYYDGTVPTENPEEWEVTTADDGSRTLTQRKVNYDDHGLCYETRKHYDAQGRLLTATYLRQRLEYRRVEYQYGQDGSVQETLYTNGDQECDHTVTLQYNNKGQPVRREAVIFNRSDPADPPGFGIAVSNRIPDRITTVETYRYNDQGLLVETVTCQDNEETHRTTYDYDEMGYPLPRYNRPYEYAYSPEGTLEQVWLLREECADGAAQLRSRTVYVTPENAHRLQEIMRTALYRL